MTNYGCQPFSAYLRAVAAMHDNDINFLYCYITTCINMDKTNGQTVILVHLLMFAVDSIS